MSKLLQYPKIKTEIEKAVLSKKEGFEGRSRVCSRRAAGFAIISFYKELNFDIQTHNILAAIVLFQKDEKIPLQLRSKASFFLEQVNPEQDLPSQVDLIKEAFALCKGLDQLITDRRK